MLQFLERRDHAGFADVLKDRPRVNQVEVALIEQGTIADPREAQIVRQRSSMFFLSKPSSPLSSTGATSNPTTLEPRFRKANEAAAMP